MAGSKPSLSPKPSPLPDHLLTTLLCHLPSLLRNFTDHSLPRLCNNPCPSPFNISFFSVLPPKWQHPFNVILVISTAHWSHLSHFDPFTPTCQDNFSLYTSTPLGSCSLKFQKTLRSTALSPATENEALPHRCAQLYWTENPIWK